MELEPWFGPGSCKILRFPGLDQRLVFMFFMHSMPFSPFLPFTTKRYRGKRLRKHFGGRFRFSVVLRMRFRCFNVNDRGKRINRKTFWPENVLCKQGLTLVSHDTSMTVRSNISVPAKLVLGHGNLVQCMQIQATRRVITILSNTSN